MVIKTVVISVRNGTPSVAIRRHYLVSESFRVIVVMAKLIFLLVLAFAAYVAAYPSPQDSVMQSLPGRVKRAPGPNPDPELRQHIETVTQDRFGNTHYSHQDVYDHDHGHHHYHPHYDSYGFLRGIFNFFG